MRNIVSIKKIDTLLPIEGADFIEVAVIGGWNVVVKKGIHTVGEDVLYFEIDSFLPFTDKRFEFLAGAGTKEFQGVKGHVLRTRKLKGVFSQGLIMPLADFPEVSLEYGKDFSEAIGVVKYEPPMPACLGGKVKGLFPSFIPKTDQERIQNIPDVLEKYKDVLFEVTLKLDGTSCTIFYNKEAERPFGVCSRNLELDLSEERMSYIAIAKRYGLQEKLMALGRNIAIQGEIIGEGIQGNPEKIRGQDFYVFDIFDIDKQQYLLADERYILAHRLGLKHTPVIHDSFSLSAFNSIGDMLLYADGESMFGKVREGLVYKSTDFVGNDVVSFKTISNKFLLKTGG